MTFSIHEIAFVLINLSRMNFMLTKSFLPKKEKKSCHKTRNEKKIQLWKTRVYIARLLIFDIYNAKLVALSILILYSPEHGISFCDKISKKIYIKIGFRPKKKMLRTVIFIFLIATLLTLQLTYSLFIFLGDDLLHHNFARQALYLT